MTPAEQAHAGAGRDPAAPGLGRRRMSEPTDGPLAEPGDLDRPMSYRQEGEELTAATAPGRPPTQ